MDKKNYFEKIKENSPSDVIAFLGSSFDRQCWLAGVIHGAMSKAEALEKVCDLLCVSESTAKRWLSGRSEPHPCAVLYLLAHYRGVPPGKDWTGWRFVGNALVSPNGESITPEVHQRLYWLTNEIRLMRHESGTAKLKTKLLESIGTHERLEKIRLAAKLLGEVTTVHL